jgi:hypothetical protein
MKKYLSIFLMLLNVTLIYSQYEFGISKSELINKIGVPDEIKKYNNNSIRYHYEVITPSLEYSNKYYFFNEYDELKEVLVIYVFTDCYNAKDKINKLLSLAKKKYSRSGMMGDNKMAFANPNDDNGLTVELTPTKTGKICMARERFWSPKYF